MADDPEKTEHTREAAANEPPEPPDTREELDGAEEEGREDSLPGLDDGAPEEEQSAEAAPSPSEAKPAKRGRVRMVLYFAVPLLCLASIAAVVVLKKPDAAGKLLGSYWKTSQKPPIVTSITRPIPIPDHREMLDFFVLEETGGQKTITVFRMEIAFSSFSRYHDFKEHNIAFRNTIYAFLLAQDASKNNHRAWQEIVEKDLFDFLRAKLPDSKPDTLRLTQVENL
jgi:hypothetical protein